jgi:DNA-binding LacI/PurR family transcriptional regulator
MINMKDLAKACGVSVATVSRVINADPAVKPETREKVLAAAKRLGFTPNLAARSLKLAKSRTVGIIIPSISNQFYYEILGYIEAELNKRGYHLLVSFIQHGVTTERDALEAMSSARLEALILSPRTCDNGEYLRMLSSQLNTKIVQIFTAPFEEYGSLVVDDFYGTYEATRYLIEHGHRRIMYIGGDNRAGGYKSALEAAGLSYDPSLVSLDWLLEEDIVAEMITSKGPTAIIAVARQAEVTWRALRKLKLSVPDDISFIAFDDVKWVGMFDITAIAHPLTEIASVLAKQLFYAIDNPDAPPEKTVIKPYLIERSSVSKIK